jgi:hypothetical protein
VKTALAVAAAVAVTLGVGGYAGWRALTPSLSPLRLPVTASCVAQANGEVDLDPEQMANAATISAVAIRRKLPARALVVALAAAMQESKLRNLPGGDRDSLGLFQQRPSEDWGTAQQIIDPRYAANAFFTALLKIKGWQDLPVTEAAQAVQRSAVPDAYARWADDAGVLTRALLGDATSAIACTLPTEPAKRGQAAAAALTSGLAADWGQLKTAPTGAVVGVTLTAANDRTGWQYAHWLVAHAEEQGVKRVRFGDQEWTAKGGQWVTVGSASSGPASAAPAAPGAPGKAPSGKAPSVPAKQVVAEVYAAQ